MIRKIAVVAAALSLLLSGVAAADGTQAGDCNKTCTPLYPPEPPKKIVKVVKTVEKVTHVQNVTRVNNVSTVGGKAGTSAAVQRGVQRGTLPRTGSDSLPLTQVGAGLLAVGAVLVLLERNRRAAQAHGNRSDVS